MKQRYTFQATAPNGAAYKLHATALSEATARLILADHAETSVVETMELLSPKEPVPGEPLTPKQEEDALKLRLNTVLSIHEGWTNVAPAPTRHIGGVPPLVGTPPGFGKGQSFPPRYTDSHTAMRRIEDAFTGDMFTSWAKELYSAVDDTVIAQGGYGMYEILEPVEVGAMMSLASPLTRAIAAANTLKLKF